MSRETTGATDAAALAASLGISLEEAHRRLNAGRKVAHGATLVEKYGAENVRYGIACGNCDVTRAGGVGPCGPGFCNECDTMDRIKPGFIARGMARKAKELARAA
jgi:hypothetical protein